jgi:hypothetical protein
VNNNKLPYFFFGIFLYYVPVAAKAQVIVTSPIERSVYQRDTSGFGSVTVSGSYSAFLDKIEVQAIPVIIGQGIIVTWNTLQDNPTGGVFSGSIRLFGGWYKLEIRGIRNGKVVGNTISVSKFGIGEVFIIAGQSNAQGIDYTSPSAKDDRVNYIAYDNEIKNSLEDLPPPVFTQLSSDTHTMGLRGHGNWCYGILGDLLVQKLNVPVVFVNTGWDGTGLMNWVLSSQNLPTWDVYSGLLLFPPQMPYANLRLSLQHYVKQYGARCILWMQGESDNLPLKTNFNNYKSGLESLIGKLENDVGKSVCWVIARTSRRGDQNNVSTVSPSVIAAQNAVINSLPEKTYPGPETDKLYEVRGDGTHFTGITGVTILANAWNESLSTVFFSKIKPTLSSEEPKIASVCGPDNASISLNVPDNYQTYEWIGEVAGNTTNYLGRTLTVTQQGKYYAKVKDNKGNTLRTQTIVVNTSPKPIQPTIVEPLEQQVCNEGSVVFSISDNQDQYSWYKVGSTLSIQDGLQLTAKQTGKYYVKGENVFGCMSEDSQTASLLVQPKIPVPSIISTTPFSIQAKIQTNDFKESYEWMVDQKRIPDVSESYLHGVVSGEYSVRARVDFTLSDISLACFSDYSDNFLISQGSDFEVVVYPNPGPSDNIFAETSKILSDVKVEIYTVKGNLLYSRQQQMNGPFKIPAIFRTPGKYIIRVLGDSIDVSKSFVVN